MRAYTDYPLTKGSALGESKVYDEPHKPAPIREVEVIGWDDNKYCQVKFENGYYCFKAGYLYSTPVREGIGISMVGVPIIDVDKVMPEKRFVIVTLADAVKAGWVDECYDAEYRNGLFDTSKDPPEEVFCDGGEPEDMLLYRNLSIFPQLLNKLAAENEALKAELNKLIGK